MIRYQFPEITRESCILSLLGIIPFYRYQNCPSGSFSVSSLQTMPLQLILRRDFNFICQKKAFFTNYRLTPRGNYHSCVTAHKNPTWWVFENSLASEIASLLVKPRPWAKFGKLTNLGCIFPSLPNMNCHSD